MGSMELRETAEVVVGELTEMTESILCLAENFKDKLEGIGQTIDDLDTNISNASAQTSMYLYKCDLNRLKSLSTTKFPEKMPREKKSLRPEEELAKFKSDAGSASSRIKVDFDELDHVGFGGVKQEKPEEPKEAKLVPEVPDYIYKQSEPKPLPSEKSSTMTIQPRYGTISR